MMCRPILTSDSADKTDDEISVKLASLAIWDIAARAPIDLQQFNFTTSLQVQSAQSLTAVFVRLPRCLSKNATKLLICFLLQQLQ